MPDAAGGSTLGTSVRSRVRETSMHRATYEIHLRDAPPPELLASLAGATCTEASGETVLLTLDIDQESLHQLVARLRDLGIELLELRQASATGGTRRTREKP